MVSTAALEDTKKASQVPGSPYTERSFLHGTPVYAASTDGSLVELKGRRGAEFDIIERRERADNITYLLRSQRDPSHFAHLALSREREKLLGENEVGLYGVNEERRTIFYFGQKNPTPGDRDRMAWIMECEVV